MSRGNALETAAVIARGAGALILGCDRAPSGKGHNDVVTLADERAEGFILRELRAAFPAHSVLSEEGGGGDGAGECRWYVDPLDGTKNFAHHNPHFAVSLALECHGELVAAVTYDPSRDELFTAERGAGAFLNGRRISVSATAILADALVASGYPSGKRSGGNGLELFHRCLKRTLGLRRTGCSTLDLAWVACGRFDAVWEYGLAPWDIAAGILLVQEAGGRCSDLDGYPCTPSSGDLAADNGVLHQELLSLFELPRVSR